MSLEEEIDEIIYAPNFIMEHCGMKYKFGVHDFVYRWSDTSNCWLKSDVSADTLRHPIRLRLTKERLNEATY